MIHALYSNVLVIITQNWILIIINCTQSHPGMCGPPKQWTSSVVLPLYHVYAINIHFIRQMAGGAKLIVMNSFDAKQLLESIEIYQVCINISLLSITSYLIEMK